MRRAPLRVFRVDVITTHRLKLLSIEPDALADMAPSERTNAGAIHSAMPKMAAMTMLTRS